MYIYMKKISLGLVDFMNKHRRQKKTTSRGQRGSWF